MKHSFTRLLAAVCFVAIGTLDSVPAASQTAQSQPPIVVGIVDIDYIMNESKAALSAKAQLEKQATDLKAEVRKQQKAFQDSEQKLRDQRDKLSEDDLKKKIEELNAQGEKTKKKLAQQEKALEANHRKANEKIRETLLGIIREIATKRGMTLVMNKTYVPVFAEQYDVTAEAMKRLNEKMPSLKL